jgi:hypothetical protein
MPAALVFVCALENESLLERVRGVQTDLYVPWLSRDEGTQRIGLSFWG